MVTRMHRPACSTVAVLAMASLIACRKASPASPASPAADNDTIAESVPASTEQESEPEPEAPAVKAIEPRVVLVTIDGVRWQDVFGGADARLAGNRDVGPFTDPALLLPHLHARIANGVALGAGGDGCGVVRTRGTSSVSLPGYFEILSGRSTSCRANTCSRIASPTILDEVALAGIGPVASIASWEMLERAASSGANDVVVSAGTRAWPTPIASSPLADVVERGARSGPFPAPGGNYRPDASTTAIALEYLRSEHPRLLHVGLGDADEWGHRGDYVSYLNAIHESDAFIGDLMTVLDDEGLLESTTVLVTTDHGRARDFRSHGAAWPESRRAFLLGFGHGIASRAARCASRDIELPDIGATVASLLSVRPPTGSTAGVPIEEIVGRAADL